MAREHLTWDRDFQTTKSGSLENGDVSWFMEGQLNASYNCIDRHAFKNPDKPAIIYQGNGDYELVKDVIIDDYLRQRIIKVSIPFNIHSYFLILQ